eukprot:1911617-Pleurochrysis_carterae.AAC.1
MHARTHARTYARSQARTHACAHASQHAPSREQAASTRAARLIVHRRHATPTAEERFAMHD